MKLSEFLRQDRQDAGVNLASLLGHVVFLGALGYAEIHNAHLFLKGIAPGWEFIAFLGLFCMGMTALNLHFGGSTFSRSPTLRGWADFFFWADMLLMTVNVVVDYATNTSAKLPDWASDYTFYVIPACPLFCAVIWAVLTRLDPKHKQAASRAALEGKEAALNLELETSSKVAYLDSKIKYAQEDAQYLAALESAAVRDLWNATQRQFGTGRPETLGVRASRPAQPLPQPLEFPGQGETSVKRPAQPTNAADSSTENPN